MEGGVEHDSLRHIGQHLAHGVDTGQVAGSVQRRQVGEGLDFLDDLVGHQHTVVEALAAVGHTVADGTYLVEVLDDTHRRVNQGVEDNLDTGGMVGDGHLFVVFLTVPLVGELTHFQTDALQQTFGHHLGVVCHVDQLILDRRTSAV